MWRIASFADGITNGQIDRSHLGQRHTTWGCRSELRRRQRLQACVLLGIDSVENRNDRGPGSLDETIAHATALDKIEVNLTSGHVTSPIMLTSGEPISGQPWILKARAPLTSPSSRRSGRGPLAAPVPRSSTQAEIVGCHERPGQDIAGRNG
jgi:hypothetical protein